MVDLVIDFLMSRCCSFGQRMSTAVKRSPLSCIVIFCIDGDECSSSIKLEQYTLSSSDLMSGFLTKRLINSAGIRALHLRSFNSRSEFAVILLKLCTYTQRNKCSVLEADASMFNSHTEVQPFRLNFFNWGNAKWNSAKSPT